MAILVHVITGLKTGGAERSLYNLLSGGLTELHQCHVVTLTDKGDFGAKIEALGVRVHALGMAPGRPSVAGLKSLYEFVRSVRPELIQGWMYHGNLVASLARTVAAERPALLWNIRSSLHDVSKEKLGTRMAIRTGRLFSRQPDCILYNSDVSRAQHESFGFHAAHADVIANGFDTSLWWPDPLARQQMRATLGLVPGDKLVGFVGRYHPMKDIPTFLQAMAELMAVDQHLHCVVVGQDVRPENSALEFFFSALPEKRVHVLGRRDDVAKLMPGFDLLCLSSSWGEAFPNVIGEAMSCGLPCVATDVGDCRHIIGDTGRIVASSDPVALRQALGTLLGLTSNARTALGAAARSRIESTFGLSATVDRYSSVYDQLLKRKW